MFRLFKKKTIKEYCVLEEKRYHDLMDEVNKLLKEGWIPQGNVTAYVYVSGTGNGITESNWNYLQAMTKE